MAKARDGVGRSGADDGRRVAALRRTGLLFGDSFGHFGRLIQRINEVFGGNRSAFLGLVDHTFEQVRIGDARLHGLFARSVGFAAAAVDAPDGRVTVTDLAAHPRLRRNAMVGPPNAIRSLIGEAVTCPEGERIGALCLVGPVPAATSEANAEAFSVFAAEASALVAQHCGERAANRQLALEACDASTARTVPLAFQPIRRARDLAPVGFEALLRWRARDGTPLPPDTLLSVAERVGLMRRIDNGVLRSALLAASVWPSSLKVSVNISGQWFGSTDPSLVADVEQLLWETSFAPERLMLEVTEQVLIRDQARARAELEAVRGLGVRIALDDFGTGWSSLSYLASLPLDVVKLDRSFARPLPGDSRGATLVRGVTGLCHGLGMEVCVEGIERDDQLALARECGCELVQGYLLGPPTADVDAVFAAGPVGLTA